MTDTAVATRIHLLPPPGTVLFRCEKCGQSLAEVDYANKGCFRYIKTRYNGQRIKVMQDRVLERKVNCIHCGAEATEPDFTKCLPEI